MKKMAIMKGVGIGMRDYYHPCMWFSAYTDEHTAALQVLSWDEAANVIKSTGVQDVHDLEGRTCWVDDDGTKITFLEVIKYVGDKQKET